MINIKNLTLNEIEEDFETMEIPLYRAKQIYSWIFTKGVSDFELMTTLPKDLRVKLKQKYIINSLEIDKHFISKKDKTEKFLFKLNDGNLIETVLIITNKRKTICLSTQVGCKFKCQFCASGAEGFIRNLTVSEILDQILILKYKFEHDITNYVFMGIGEPLDNYTNLEKAILIMNSKNTMNIGARKITVSTSGYIPGIIKLMELGLQVNLSLSLHTTNNKLRDKLMPINKNYPIDAVIKICGKYVKQTNRLMTLEYTLIKGVNDSQKDIEMLSLTAQKLRAKINIIPLSIVGKNKLQAPDVKDTKLFLTHLLKKNVKATIRDSKGKDISAACGQLRLTRN